MNCFIVLARPAPKSSHNPAGGEIGTFETQEEAEYFMSLAANLRRFRQCDLAVTKAVTWRAGKCVPMPHGDQPSNSTARIGITARRPPLQVLEQAKHRLPASGAALGPAPTMTPEVGAIREALPLVAARR